MNLVVEKLTGPIMEALGWTLLHSLWQFTLVAGDATGSLTAWNVDDWTVARRWKLPAKQITLGIE